MTPLEKLLREYQYRRWYKNENEQRFSFDTREERFTFIGYLNELNTTNPTPVEYFLYSSPRCFKIDVFTK